MSLSLARLIGLLTVWLGWVLLLNQTHVQARLSFNLCPERCFCNDESKIVYCMKRNLNFIPNKISNDTSELYLDENNFTNGTLQRRNFSNLISVRKLFLRKCMIERISPLTFSDLKHLQLLDLSENNIQVLDDFTFQGLNLSYLFLSGNKGIKILSNSFQGLSTQGLFMNECDLTDLPANVIQPLVAKETLKTLALIDNKIERFSQAVLDDFQHIPHLKLFGNPLHCNCALKPLYLMYVNLTEKFKNDFTARTLECASPENLRNTPFDDIKPEDLKCSLPIINFAEVFFDEYQAAHLSCYASGDPAPVVYWSGQRSVPFTYFPANKTHTRAKLRVRKNPRSNAVEHYKCIAENEAGRSLVTLNITWPMQFNPIRDCDKKVLKESENGAIKIDSIVETYNRDENSAQATQDKNLLKKGDDFTDRRFTLTELLFAVVGTFLSTLLLFLLITVIVSRVVRKEPCGKRKTHNLKDKNMRYLTSSDELEYFDTTGTRGSRR